MENNFIKYKIAIFTSHPVHYAIALYKQIAMRPEIELMVYFASDYGIKEGYDKTFGKVVKWYDESILNGLPYKFLAERKNQDNKLKIIKTIVYEIKKELYDAVFIIGYTSLTTLTAFFGALFFRIPILLRGATEPYTYRPLWKRIIKKLLLGLFFKGIDAFLPDCMLNAEHFKKYGISDEKIFMMPSAVDNDYFQKISKKMRPDKNRIKKELGIPSDLSVILFLNKLIKRKRPLDLLMAYERIADCIKCCSVFVGDGWEKENLKLYVKKKKLKGVYFEGFKRQDQISKYYSIADIFVLPSENDASPKSLNEALNFSLPVITTDGVGTAPELVRHGKNGFIYPFGNIEALSKYLLKTLSDKKKASSMGKQSLNIVSQYSFKECVNGLLSAMKYII